MENSPVFARVLIDWQRVHGRRDLPWQDWSRQRRDPYRIWLAEIMLQQTRVATVAPYYERFLARFPDVAALAAAPVGDVMTLWSGLGYYARARNLHQCARRIVEEHGGVFPRKVEAIAHLPGIGPSTAAAIAAFAYGTRAAILDGNVKRVLCRQFGIAGFPGSKQVENQLWVLARSLLPDHDVDIYTQALMDLGATVCVRKRPACEHCPVCSECVARCERRVHELPEPRPRQPLPRRTTSVLLLLHGNSILLEQRPPAGIWGGLLALPEVDVATAPLAAQVAEKYDCAVESVELLAPLRHRFTHFQLEMRPLLCRVVPAGRQVGEDRFRWLALQEADKAALPAPVRKLLRQLATKTV
ncbi:MAG: mutY [Proteobacteria bacterium]|nr:mutY [Pseudomonadota bacterium]